MSSEILSQKTIKEVEEAINIITKNLAKAIKAICNYIETAWNAIAHRYANLKIRHLALYAKKCRIRKKNMRRMYKDFMKLLT